MFLYTHRNEFGEEDTTEVVVMMWFFLVVVFLELESSEFLRVTQHIYTRDRGEMVAIIRKSKTREKGGINYVTTAPKRQLLHNS